jgi:ketosteroid isomerase-like protein
MTQENVEQFREITESFNRFAATPRSGSPSQPSGEVLAFLNFMDPEIQFEPVQTLLQGTYVGRDGVGKWLADLAEHYVNGQIRYADIRDLGDRVLALGTLSVTGMGSGIEIEVPLAVVASFRDGLITHFKDYGDWDRALEAAGLSE